ncbi:MAG TPA: hypothetical protein ENI80_03720 [Acidiferrobacteraceae bacterium]|nr:hypothetical protein [Acidiferrobacteraceae bacterium]
MSTTTIATILRVVAGILALVSMGVAGIRFYGMNTLDTAMGAMGAIYSLRLLFPLSLAAFFGYVAWKGKLPFGPESNDSVDPKD